MKIPPLTGMITFSLALTVYGLTLAPDLTWANHSGDGPELITAAMTLGVPHPPGYPTYTLLGYLFGQLPLGTVAFRFNLFSAVGMAVAAGFVAATVQRGGGRKTRATFPSSVLGPPSFVAIATGLSLALAPLVWGQATVSEVYGLYMALLAAALWALWWDQPRPWLSGALLGLAVTAHLTALFWLPLALVRLRPRQWPALAGGLVLGLTPFLALPWLAQSDGPLVWGRPDTLSGWWWLVTARIYHPNLLAHGWFYSGQQAWQLLGLVVVQFTPLGLLLVGYGGVRGWQTAVSPRERWGWLVMGGTAVVYFIYAAIYHTPDYHVFFLPALLPLAWLLSPALTDITAKLSGWLRPPAAPAAWFLKAWPLLLPLTLLLLHFSEQNLRQETRVRPGAIALLQAIPADAIVITPGDQTISTLWYFQAVEGQRPDLVLVDRNLFGFDWYRERLISQHPFLSRLEGDDLFHLEVTHVLERPLCYAGFNPDKTPIISC
jgi:hypothetical protein